MQRQCVCERRMRYNGGGYRVRVSLAALYPIGDERRVQGIWMGAERQRMSVGGLGGEVARVFGIKGGVRLKVGDMLLPREERARLIRPGDTLVVIPQVERDITHHENTLHEEIIRAKKNTEDKKNTKGKEDDKTRVDIDSAGDTDSTEHNIFTIERTNRETADDSRAPMDMEIADDTASEQSQQESEQSLPESEPSLQAAKQRALELLEETAAVSEPPLAKRARRRTRRRRRPATSPPPRTPQTVDALYRTLNLLSQRTFLASPSLSPSANAPSPLPSAPPNPNVSGHESRTPRLVHSIL